MMGTITPVVHGSRRWKRWYRLIGVYCCTQIAGGALTGLLVGSLGSLIWAARYLEDAPMGALFGVVAAAAALHDIQMLPFHLPSRGWQVPQSWKRFTPSVTVACYGFCIGTGFLTRIPFASFYLLLFGCIGGGSIVRGVGLMSLYAAARAVTVAIAAHGQAFTSTPYRRFTRIARLRPMIGYVEGLVLAGVAGFVLAAMLD